LARIVFGCAVLSLPATVEAVPVTAGLKLWLDSTQGVSISGNTVTSWTDQSGYGHDGTYGSGAPQIVSGAINGLPAISFNGNGDYFSLAGGQVLSSDSFTIFAVGVDTGNSDGEAREIYSNWDFGNSWSSQFLGTSAGDDGSRTLRFTDGLLAANALSVPATPFISYGVYVGGVNADLYLNGNLIGSNPQNNDPADVLNPNGQRDITTPSFIGRQGNFEGEYWQGYIAEVLVYDGALSPEDQAAVAEYLQAKWVPEPSSFVLATVSALGMFLYRRRK
jgi:hypothetical protein